MSQCSSLHVEQLTSSYKNFGIGDYLFISRNSNKVYETKHLIACSHWRL